MELMKLDESCRGKKLVFRYQTEYYYDVEFREREDTFTVALTRRAFPAPVEKQFEDTLMEPWLEEPQVFAAVEAGRELGYLELSHERWNNRMRVSNLWVAEDCRRGGVGRGLMERAVAEARSAGTRSLVLETQSCNYPAICFYRKMGFSLIGFDLTAYSQTDVERKEVRLEFARPV
ncbi:MAG TPA: GNAT family N-acetyltransferase [Candidatus Enterenecus stercoripullorum]|nr:GNAT family N-acetyltransferase [Candidatus Enterenecus stercoripullorum]